MEDSTTSVPGSSLFLRRAQNLFRSLGVEHSARRSKKRKSTGLRKNDTAILCGGSYDKGELKTTRKRRRQDICDLSSKIEQASSPRSQNSDESFLSLIGSGAPDSSSHAVISTSPQRNLQRSTSNSGHGSKDGSVAPGHLNARDEKGAVACYRHGRIENSALAQSAGQLSALEWGRPELRAPSFPTLRLQAPLEPHALRQVEQRLKALQLHFAQAHEPYRGLRYTLARRSLLTLLESLMFESPGNTNSVSRDQTTKSRARQAFGKVAKTRVSVGTVLRLPGVTQDLLTSAYVDFILTLP
eukprot:g4767.t1